MQGVYRRSDVGRRMPRRTTLLVSAHISSTEIWTVWRTYVSAALTKLCGKSLIFSFIFSRTAHRLSLCPLSLSASMLKAISPFFWSAHICRRQFTWHIITIYKPLVPPLRRLLRLVSLEAPLSPRPYTLAFPIVSRIWNGRPLVIITRPSFRNRLSTVPSLNITLFPTFWLRTYTI